jgi:hypothetical protein
MIIYINIDILKILAWYLVKKKEIRGKSPGHPLN